MKRIFITGGHLTPALAVITELKSRGGWEVYYVGRRTAMEGDKAEALEYGVLANNPEVHYLVTIAGRIQPMFFVNFLQSLGAAGRIPLGFIQAIYWVIRYQPDLILSFGGYLAVPIAVSGWFLGVPVATHEQTVVAGSANLLLARLAKVVMVSWKESMGKFPKKKIVFTGNPMPKELFQKDELKLRSNLKTIFVSGGKQGSHVINMAVSEVLPKLVEKYRIIHQTGDSAINRDYEKLRDEATRLAIGPDKYKVVKVFDPSEFIEVLRCADLFIGRSGANAVSHVAALGKVAIFVPIPWSKRDEQNLNAQLLVRVGGAFVIKQDELSGEKLREIIDQIARDFKKVQLGAAAAKSLVVSSAAEKIVDEVEKI